MDMASVKKSQDANKLARLLKKKEMIMFLVLLAMVIVSGIINPVFISAANLLNIMGQSAIIGTMALGMVFALITGSFDMSVSSTAALTGVFAAHMFKSMGFLPGVGVGLLTGVTIGLINGLLVTKVGINPFVTTLGMQTLGRGVVYIVTGAMPITGIPARYGVLGMGTVLGNIPVPAIIWMSLAIVMGLVLGKTRFGQYVYATGGNQRAAWLSGVNTDRIKITALILSGLFASIGGIIYNLRVLISTADALSGYELNVMAACIVGGTALEGGRGSVLGTVIGTLIMGMVLNILQLAGVSTFWQSAITGIILIGAVSVDSLSSKKRG